MAISRKKFGIVALIVVAVVAMVVAVKSPKVQGWISKIMPSK